MGVSNDAVLVFGQDFQEELPDFLVQAAEQGLEFEDLVYRLAGLADNWRDNMTDLERSTLCDLRREALDACPVDLVRYCSWDYPMYILAVRGTEISASRGNIREVDPEELLVDPRKITAAREWLAQFDIEFEPRWLLNTMND